MHVLTQIHTAQAVLHAEAVEQAEEEAAHEATEADESLLNKQLEIEYADQTGVAPPSRH